MKFQLLIAVSGSMTFVDVYSDVIEIQTIQTA